MSKTVDVVIDQRESRSDVIEEFYNHEDVDSVDVEMLDIGDVIVDGEVIFERKSKGDFVQSIQNHRLENQVERMYDLFEPENSYVIVEADYTDFEYLPYSHFSPASVYGFVGSLAARWQMIPLFVSDTEHLVDTVTRVGRKHAEDTERVVRSPTDTPSAANDDYFARAVLQFDGVGKSKIDPLRERFGTIEELVEASEDQLTTIDGIGNSTAESIKKQLGVDDGS